MTWRPTTAQQAAARGRVADTFARLLAEQHPGHRFIIEWRESPQPLRRPARPRQIPRQIIDQQHRRTAA